MENQFTQAELKVTLDALQVKQYQLAETFRYAENRPEKLAELEQIGTLITKVKGLLHEME